MTRKATSPMMLISSNFSTTFFGSNSEAPAASPAASQSARVRSTPTLPAPTLPRRLRMVFGAGKPTRPAPALPA